jgi:hypothetical protein
MVRLLSRQHGRDRPLLQNGAVKTAEALIWGRTIVAIAPATELRTCAFFAPARICALAARQRLGTPGAGWRRNINEEIRRASMTCPRRT